MNILLVIWDAQ